MSEHARDVLKYKRQPSRVRLNKRTVEAITPPPSEGGRPSRTWVCDVTTPRLELCVWSTGRKTWYWVGRVHGRPVRVKLGSFPEMTPEQARKLAASTSAGVAEGIDPRDDRRKMREGLTLGGAFGEYLDRYAKQHKRTWQEDERTFRRYCGRLKSRRLADIKRADIGNLHAQVGKRGKYAANRLLALLSKVFNFAETELGHEAGNPCKGIKRFREQSRDRFLKPAELGRFFAALEAEPPTMRDFFLVSLLTGARKGNVESMRWDELSLDRGEWRIPRTKAGESQVVYLPAQAVEILRQRQQTSKSQYVFPARTGAKSGHITRPYASWKRICQRARLTDLRPHDLRRSLGSWQAATGASLPVIGKTLGHRNQSTTAVYARLDLSPVRASVDAAVSAMLAAADAAAADKPAEGSR